MSQIIDDMRFLLIFISALLLITSCKKDDDNSKKDGPAKQTVIVYISGENDLSIFAAMDTTEMIAGSKSISSDCNYIAFLDISQSTEKPSIWKYEDGKKTLVRQYEEDFYNSDPERMLETLQWIIDKYPANNYGLVLWGHAEGWVIMKDSVAIPENSPLRRAYGRDTGDNSKHTTKGNWINIPTLANVLKHLTAKFDYIFCDCCNMSNAETAYELRKVTNYLIASPAEIPGYGAPYEKITPYLFSNNTTAYQSVADTYANYYSGNLPMAVIKMSEMEQLANATNVILQTLEPTAEKDFKLDNLIYYDGVTSRSLRTVFDMNDLLMQNATTENYQQWKKALDRAVIYKRYAASWQTNGHVNFRLFIPTEEKFGGINMFFPRPFYDNDNYSKTYNSTYHQMQWYWATGWNNYGW